MSDRTVTIAITRSMYELLKLYVPVNGLLRELLWNTIRDNRPKGLLRFSTNALLASGSLNAAANSVDAAMELRTTIRTALARPRLAEKTCERLRLDLNALDEFLDTPVVDRVAGLA